MPAIRESRRGTDGFTYGRQVLFAAVSSAGCEELLVILRIVDAVGHHVVGHFLELGLVILEIVHRVDASARAFLDGTAGAMLLLGAFLATQTLGRRWRSEVRAAVASSRPTHGARTCGARP